jgi:hypothetical protein
MPITQPILRLALICGFTPVFEQHLRFKERVEDFHVEKFDSLLSIEHLGVPIFQ